MRVCLYTETALPLMGGQEMVIDALAHHLVELGNQVVVLAPRPSRRLRFSDKDRPYDVVRHPRFISTRRCLDWYTRYVANAHRKYRFDIVHCHSVYPAGYVAARCSAVANVPLVITSHCGDICPSSTLLRKQGIGERYEWTLQRADAAIAISDFTEERLRGLCPRLKRLARIPNGVELAKYSEPVRRPETLPPEIGSKRYFFFMGRLVHRKGADLLLSAYAAARAAGQYYVVVGGDGPEESTLRQQAAELHIDDRVLFVGRVAGDGKTWLLQNALCTIIPSRISEGFPLVFLESCAAGRPVIGTRIPGLSGLVQPGETGLLVAPDSADAIQQALSLASNDPHYLDQMGNHARRAASQYDWRIVAQSHLALYSELGHSGQRRKSA